MYLINLGIGQNGMPMDPQDWSLFALKHPFWGSMILRYLFNHTHFTLLLASTPSASFASHSSALIFCIHLSWNYVSSCVCVPHNFDLTKSWRTHYKFCSITEVNARLTSRNAMWAACLKGNVSLWMSEVSGLHSNDFRASISNAVSSDVFLRMIWRGRLYFFCELEMQLLGFLTDSQ